MPGPGRLQVVRWHRSLDTLPTDAPTLFLAHEFFDALPAHLFRKDDGKWREVRPEALSSIQVL